MAWTTNCRLIAAQLTLALILVYLHNINRMIQLDKQLHHSKHMPHPVHSRHDVQTTLKSTARPLTSSARKPDHDRCTDLRRPEPAANSSWQRHDHRSGTIYVYSAVYDDRESDGAVIRLLVIASGLRDHSTDVYCHIWLSNVIEPVVVDAKFIDLDIKTREDRAENERYGQYVVTCPVEQSAAAAVSLVVGNRCGGGSTSTPVQRPSAASEAAEFGVCAVLTWPVTESSQQEPNQTAPWFLEWMELQLAVFGATRVFLYVTFDDDLTPLQPLLRLYVNRKSLVVSRIPHPVDGTRRSRPEIIADVRAVAVNDCLLRNQRHFRYLMEIDFDELIVPRHVAQNYTEMVARIDTIANKQSAKAVNHTQPAAIVYFFHIISFFLDIPIDDPNVSRFMTTGNFRSRDKPVKGVLRSMVDTQRCTVLRPSTGCEVRGRPVGGRTSTKTGMVDVPLNVAGCHRYRRACSPPSPETDCTESGQHATPIKDRGILRFQPRLKLPVIQAMKDSGTVDKAKLYQVALLA